MSDSRNALPRGTILVAKNGDRYTITDTIGSGGSGIVYRVEKEGGGERSSLPYAIKEIFPRKCTGIERDAETGMVVARTEEGNRILEEAFAYAEEEKVIGSAIAKTPSTNPLYESISTEAFIRDGVRYEAEYRFFLTLSLTENSEKLPEIVDNEKEELTLSGCLKLFKEICLACAEVHNAGFAHLDLNQKNVLLFGYRKEDYGRALLIDFGCSCRVNEDGYAINPGRDVFTTESFGAPECRDGKHDWSRISQASDVYSLGKILYYILYYGETSEDGAHCTLMKPHAERLKGARWRDGVNRILEKCLEEDETKRYRNASELVAAVESLQEAIASPELHAPIDIPHNFDNRHAEVAALVEKLEKSEERVLRICGPGGMGKSTLAAKVLHSYSTKHPEYKVLFVRYSKSLKNTIAALYCKGEEGVRSTFLLEKDEKKVESRFWDNIDVLLEYQKTDVLYIDNYFLEDVGSMEELKAKDKDAWAALYKSPVKIMLSTKYKGLESEEIAHLPIEELDKIFLQENYEMAEEEKKDREKIYKICGYNTYVISLLGKSLEPPPLGLSVKNILEKLQDKQLEFKSSTEKDAIPRYESMDNFLTEIWDVASLTEEEKKILHLVAIFTSPYGMDAVTLARAFDLMEYTESMKRLIRKNWIIVNGNFLFLHDMVRYFVWKNSNQKEWAIETTWNLLWKIAKQGKDVIQQYLSLYSNVKGLGDSLRAGIYHIGICNYKMAYHYFWSILSNDYTKRETEILQALIGINMCLRKGGFSENPDLISLVKEQLLYGIPMSGLLIANNTSHKVKEAYQLCLNSLCEIIDGKEGRKPEEVIPSKDCVRFIDGMKQYCDKIRYHEKEELLQDILLYCKEYGELLSEQTRKLISVSCDYLLLVHGKHVQEYMNRYASRKELQEAIIREFQRTPICYAGISTNGGLMRMAQLMLGVAPKEIAEKYVADIVAELEQCGVIMLPEFLIFYADFLHKEKRYQEAITYYRKGLDLLVYPEILDIVQVTDYVNSRIDAANQCIKSEKSVKHEVAKTLMRIAENNLGSVMVHKKDVYYGVALQNYFSRTGDLQERGLSLDQDLELWRMMRETPLQDKWKYWLKRE